MKVMAVIGLNQKWRQYMQESVLVVRLKGATAFVINAILNLTALNLNAGVVVVVRIDAAKNKKQNQKQKHFFIQNMESNQPK